jgi:NurA domain
VLELHFFYLNVGRMGKPWLARVEVPGWVVASQELLDNLHAVLVEQCRSLGSRPYPYLLHRAHETALVSLEEREQVTQMIALEYRRLGVPFQGQSNKQANKDLAGRTRYTA